jgi:hypothetical protein
MRADEGISTDRTSDAAAPVRRRQPIYIVASPRSQVGRTLLARALTEYVLSNGRRALAFDVNPDDRNLSRHLPLNALPASITETRGQMALFDRLIVNDGSVKIVDVAADQFQPFFDVMHHIGFPGEARARGIDPIVLFIIGDDRKTESGYRRLLLRREQLAVVPVENPAVAPPPSLNSASFPHVAQPFVVPMLAVEHDGAPDKADFSFAGALKRHSNYPPEVSGWAGRMFLALRDLERRLEQADFATMFRGTVIA